MKILVRIVAIIFSVITLFALYDSLANGLFQKDDYKPITEQMRELTK